MIAAGHGPDVETIGDTDGERTGLDLLVVDDHAVFTDTLSEALEKQDLVRRCTSCHGVDDARRLVRDHPVDLALVDLRMPGVEGVELVGELAESTVVIVLSVMEDDRTILAAFEAGARGFISKTEGFDAILIAIRAVTQGGVPISPSIMARLLPRLLPTGESLLTPREESVLALMAEGLSNARIAEELDVSPNTVRNHTYNIMRKLDVSSRSLAVKEARRRRLLPGA